MADSEGSGRLRPGEARVQPGAPRAHVVGGLVVAPRDRVVVEQVRVQEVLAHPRAALGPADHGVGDAVRARGLVGGVEAVGDRDRLGGGAVRHRVHALVGRRGEVRADVDIEETFALAAGPFYFRALVSQEPLDRKLIDTVVDMIATKVRPD